MGAEMKQTLTYPCSDCSCLQKHEIEKAQSTDGTHAVVCMECETVSGYAVDIETD